MQKYLKLGEKASSFFDPITRLKLINNMVIEALPIQLKSPRVKRFIQGGGLSYATKEEYNEYQATLSKPVKAKTKVEKVEEPKEKGLNDMTKAEIYDYIKNSGWDAEDIETGLAIDKKSDLLDFVKNTEAAYEDTEE